MFHYIELNKQCIIFSSLCTPFKWLSGSFSPSISAAYEKHPAKYIRGQVFGIEEAYLICSSFVSCRQYCNTSFNFRQGEIVSDWWRSFLGGASISVWSLFAYFFFTSWNSGGKPTGNLEQRSWASLGVRLHSILFQMDMLLNKACYLLLDVKINQVSIFFFFLFITAFVASLTCKATLH